MRDPDYAEAVAHIDRRRVKYRRDDQRNTLAIWTLIAGGLIMSCMALSGALGWGIPF